MSKNRKTYMVEAKAKRKKAEMMWAAWEQMQKKLREVTEAEKEAWTKAIAARVEAEGAVRAEAEEARREAKAKGGLA